MISKRKLIEAIDNRVDRTGHVFIDLEVMVKMIKDIPEEDGWIPCSERLPDKQGCYLVTTDIFPGGDIAIFYYDENQDWSDVLAWRLLPDPWKGE